ncbi:pilus assembly protein PilW [Shewanella mangrovi]|uniref:Pilus assembly protein PilW n=1 Tax=Shewanella mangrovi TaxID=1515746 RepID=A0A094LSV5_9GAMM|nr:PilW family protein [Shewanella mangrovi]KFZ38268.1 pilus assembly protein PilW [Shewanella mangrovi]
MTNKGFSLVELMVAMVISLFLTLGVFTMFSMSATNVTTTGQYNQLQENGRMALAIMAPDIEQVAFFGDVTGSDFIVGTNTTVDAAITNDCIGGGLNNRTLPVDIASHFRRIWGYEVGVSATSIDCVTDANAGTDVIQIKRLKGPAGATTGFRVATTSSQIIFRGNSTGTAVKNQRVWNYEHNIYYIGNDNGIPSLKRYSLSDSGSMDNSEGAIVQGIENMRILYGYDNDGDDAADRFLPVENVTDLMWDNQSFQRIVAVKIFLLVRAVEEDRSYTDTVTYQLADKTITPTDYEGSEHYRRKVLSTTVMLENPVLIRN